ncbi:MAG: glycosyltransferase [Bacilli bacterium]|nr:glycosyltransferase [Bacilli bacterium]
MSLQLIKTLQTDFLRRLTDDTGIFQHTKYGIPDRTKGYTTDDNARALIVAVLLYKNIRDKDSLDLLHTYLSFIHHAQNEDGSFKNFMDYNRVFIDDRGSEDCLGRTLWALGFALSESSVPDNIQNTCRFLINQALPHIKKLNSPRAMAYAIVGLGFLVETPHALTYAFPYPTRENESESSKNLQRAAIISLIEELASRLHMQYDMNKDEDWHWFEDSITYSNAMLPWALFKAARITIRTDLKETAQESLDFLSSKTFSEQGYLKPIGSNGWLHRHGEAALYDEQPIEACEMLLAYQEAYEVLRDSKYLEQMNLCYEWFLGRNSLRVSLIDPQSGGCYDGIHASGLNLNQGSESIISYAIAHLLIYNG